MAVKKAGSTGRPRKAPRKKVAASSKGLAAPDVSATVPEDGARLADQIRADGGSALAVYREPLGGHTVVAAALPIDKVEPTPYQRDLSEPHVKRLANAFERVGRYLDPIIAVRHEGKYWTPNGNHRLGAMRLLGAKAVVALVLPEEELAFQILALNTEKAHNLKERSLEVIRMARGMAALGPGKESDFADVFEEPAFLTLGAAYEKRPRFSGGAYNPIVKRLEAFFDKPLAAALEVRSARADTLLAFDDAVIAVVERLKARGLQSPYLKAYVVARVNFLRFKKEGPFDFDATLAKLTASVKKVDPETVKREDLSRMGGVPSESAEE